MNGVANPIDRYVNEWPDALEKLKAIDFVDVIPGHGEPFKGKERAEWFQAYLQGRSIVATDASSPVEQVLCMDLRICPQQLAVPRS